MARQLIQSTILPSFPNAQFVMGYGSGVFSQKSYSKSDKPVIDLIIAVEDSENWHKENLKKNNHHYTGIKNLPNPSSKISHLQNYYSAHIYYNPIVSIGENKVKYGVMDQKYLLNDLNNWNDLYVAGRLHKPCMILQTTDEIQKAQDKNLFSAVAIGCLLLPNQFSKRDLFIKISSLSYHGDIRFLFRSENPKKVENIVDASLDRFSTYYENTLNQFITKEYLAWDESSQLFNSSIYDQTNINDILKQLPSTLIKDTSITPSKENIEEILAKIVRYSSASQTLKGVFSSGISNSASYVLQKFKKSFQK